MKKHFLTGLVIIIPFFLTAYIIQIVFRIVGKFFTPAFTKIFEAFVPIHIPNFAVIFVSAVVTLLLIWFIGILASNFIGKKLFHIAETLLLKIPMASGIYDAISKLMKVFFADKSNFKRVVLIEWPRKGVYSVAFVTSDAMGEVQESTKEEVMNVFMPTTPNPTTGFLVLVPKTDVIPLKMSVDDAIKLIISGGIVVPPANPK
ncbi:MAG: DUF502 domain-containing protein [Elusimicrobiota bacterium]|nr:DUF502 domain-containing protein [Elusimicrobiota bacterium]